MVLVHLETGVRELDIVANINQKIMCAMCGLLSLDPQIMSCGNILCPSCLTALSMKEGKCSCSTRCGQPFSFKNFESQVLNLMVKCPNFSFGCKVLIPIRCVNDHLKSCKRMEKTVPSQRDSDIHDVVGNLADTVSVAMDMGFPLNFDVWEQSFPIKFEKSSSAADVRSTVSKTTPTRGVRGSFSQSIEKERSHRPRQSNSKEALKHFTDSRKTCMHTVEEKSLVASPSLTNADSLEPASTESHKVRGHHKKMNENDILYMDEGVLKLLESGVTGRTRGVRQAPQHDQSTRASMSANRTCLAPTYKQLAIADEQLYKKYETKYNLKKVRIVLEKMEQPIADEDMKVVAEREVANITSSKLEPSARFEKCKDLRRAKPNFNSDEQSDSAQGKTFENKKITVSACNSSQPIATPVVRLRGLKMTAVSGDGTAPDDSDNFLSRAYHDKNKSSALDWFPRNEQLHDDDNNNNNNQNNSPTVTSEKQRLQANLRLCGTQWDTVETAREIAQPICLNDVEASNRLSAIDVEGQLGSQKYSCRQSLNATETARSSKFSTLPEQSSQWANLGKLTDVYQRKRSLSIQDLLEQKNDEKRQRRTKSLRQDSCSKKSEETGVSGENGESSSLLNRSQYTELESNSHKIAMISADIKSFDKNQQNLLNLPIMIPLEPQVAVRANSSQHSIEESAFRPVLELDMLNWNQRIVDTDSVQCENLQLASKDSISLTTSSKRTVPSESASAGNGREHFNCESPKACNVFEENCGTKCGEETSPSSHRRALFVQDIVDCQPVSNQEIEQSFTLNPENTTCEAHPQTSWLGDVVVETSSFWASRI